MLNQLNKLSFEELDSSIIQSITNFLTPLDISRMALTSRKTRIIFGQTVQQSIQKWQSTYQTQKQYIQSNQVASFVKLEAHLSSLTMFDNKDTYTRFIQVLSPKNIDFYQTFFSAIFDRQILINPKTIASQKVILIDQRQQIIERLSYYLINTRIPTYRIQNVSILSTLTKSAQKIFDFVLLFMKLVVEIQSQPKFNEKHLKYRAAKIQIQKKKYIEKIKYNKEYTKPIYFLKQKKNYHIFMRFNVNSLVFSFLTLKELQTLVKVDKLFSYQIDNYLPLMLNRSQSRLECLNAIPIRPEMVEFEKLMIENEKYEVSKMSLTELRSCLNPPEQVQQTICMLISVLEKRTVNNYQEAMSFLYQNSDIQNLVSNTECIEFDEYQFQLVEPFISQETKRRNQNASLYCFKVYLFLHSNYLMKKHDFKNETFLEYLKNKNLIKNEIQQISEIKKIKLEVINQNQNH